MNGVKKTLSAWFGVGLVVVLALCVGGRESVAQQAGAQKPVITKIDPPDWFAGMPDPMLLLRGENFSGAKFVVAGKGVSLARSTVSENGHWAFLWLTTKGAAPQRLSIEARSAGGTATAAFALEARKPASAGFRGFSSDDVMYLIMTDRFAEGSASASKAVKPPGGFNRSASHAWHGGDLRGIAQHLDYLQALGVTTVWTTPVYDNTGSPDSYHGYGATDMYAVDPLYGTLADYQALAVALHARGMKLVLDTVPNHVGAGHPWAADPPMPDWFHGTVAKHSQPNYDFDVIPDPHSNPVKARDVMTGWFANVLPDMNQENPVVAQYLIQNAVWWVETAGLDGLRLDTFPYIRREFWRDFHAELHALYPQLTTVGEVFNGDPTVTAFFAGGVTRRGVDTGLDTPFDFPTYFALRKVFAEDKPVTELTNVWRQDWLYPHPERLVVFMGNHDTKRFLSETGATPARMELAFGLLATMRGMPQIYSGDEIAMTGGDDPENRHDFPGGFAGDAASAFTGRGRTAEQAQMFDWVSGALKVRGQHKALREGEQQDVFVDASALAFVRAKSVAEGCNGGEDRVLVVMNKATDPRDLRVAIPGTALAGCTQLTGLLNAKDGARFEGGALVVKMAGQQLAVYSVR